MTDTSLDVHPVRLIPFLYIDFVPTSRRTLIEGGTKPSLVLMKNIPIIFRCSNLNTITGLETIYPCNEQIERKISGMVAPQYIGLQDSKH